MEDEKSNITQMNNNNLINKQSKINKLNINKQPKLITITTEKISLTNLIFLQIQK